MRTILGLALLAAVGCSDRAGSRTDGAGSGTDGGAPDPCAGAAGLADSDCMLIDPVKAPTIEGGGAADYACVGSAPEQPHPTTDLVITGKTQSRESNGKDVDQGGLSVEVWTDQSDLDAAPIATDTSTKDGSYSVTIPAAAWKNATAKGARLAWRIKSRITVPTVELNDFLDVKAATMKLGKLTLEAQNRITITRGSQAVIVALLGVTFDKEKGILLGTVRDCKRRRAGNLSVGLWDPATKAVKKGPKLFYFRSRFPVTRDPEDQDGQQFTSNDGIFVLIDVDPTAQAEVRVTGKVNGKVQVVSRQRLQVKPDTIVIGEFDPLPAPL